MRRLVISALFAIALPLAASAQGADSTAGTHPLTPRVTPAFGVHYGSPLRVSGALGVIIDMNARTLDGVLLLVEPGQKGIEYSVGYLRMIGSFGSGVSLRASVIHTGEDPWNASPRTTYAGGELAWMVALGVGGRAGLFHRVGQGTGSHDSLGTIGVSIGL